MWDCDINLELIISTPVTRGTDTDCLFVFFCREILTSLSPCFSVTEGRATRGSSSTSGTTGRWRLAWSTSVSARSRSSGWKASSEPKTPLHCSLDKNRLSVLLMLRPRLTFRLIYRPISLIYFLPFCQFIKCCSRLVVQQLGCSAGSTWVYWNISWSPGVSFNKLN